MSIVLTPPILFPDNWLICPTCVISLPFSFAPYLISLRSQSCASSSSNVYCAWGPVQPCWSGFPYGLVFVCLFVCLFIYLFKIVLNKALFLLQLGPCSHPLHPPWQPLEGLAPSSTLSSPLYQQILQFKTLSSLRQWGTDVSRFALEFSGTAKGLGFNDAALKDLFNSALDEPLNWWRMTGLHHFWGICGVLGTFPS